MDTSALHTVTEALASYLTEVTPGDLAAATPCEGWDVADLVRHLLEENTHFARAVADADADNASEPDGTPCSHDAPENAYRRTALRMNQAFAAVTDPTQRRQVPGIPGPRPISDLYEMQLCDTVIHTWDLARALGLEPAVDPEIATRVLRIMELVPDSARGPGRAFGVVPVGDHRSAGTLERVVLLSGRTP